LPIMTDLIVEKIATCIEVGGGSGTDGDWWWGGAAARGKATGMPPRPWVACGRWVGAEREEPSRERKRKSSAVTAREEEGGAPRHLRARKKTELDDTHSRGRRWWWGSHNQPNTPTAATLGNVTVEGTISVVDRPILCPYFCSSFAKNTMSVKGGNPAESVNFL
jgi:hypothetical protein